MNDWLPNHTVHKPTASTGTISQPTISFHKERKYSLGILYRQCIFSTHNLRFVPVLLNSSSHYGDSEMWWNTAKMQGKLIEGFFLSVFCLLRHCHFIGKDYVIV